MDAGELERRPAERPFSRRRFLRRGWQALAAASLGETLYEPARNRAKAAAPADNVVRVLGIFPTARRTTGRNSNAPPGCAWNGPPSAMTSAFSCTR